jgi:hypothetical protein
VVTHPFHCVFTRDFGRISARRPSIPLRVGGGPLGNVEAGTVAALTSPAVSAFGGGIGCLAVAVLIAIAFPAFTRYRGQPVCRTEQDIKDSAFSVTSPEV